MGSGTEETRPLLQISVVDGSACLLRGFDPRGECTLNIWRPLAFRALCRRATGFFRLAEKLVFIPQCFRDGAGLDFVSMWVG